MSVAGGMDGWVRRTCWNVFTTDAGSGEDPPPDYRFGDRMSVFLDINQRCEQATIA